MAIRIRSFGAKRAKKGLFEEIPLLKIVGSPWKEGEIRLGVDNVSFVLLLLGGVLKRQICVTYFVIRQ